jgi:hypothetical protein
MRIRISARAHEELLAQALKRGAQGLDDSTSVRLPDQGWEIEVDPEVHARLTAFVSAGDFTMSDVILMLAGGQPS